MPAQRFEADPSPCPLPKKHRERELKIVRLKVSPGTLVVHRIRLGSAWRLDVRPSDAMPGVPNLDSRVAKIHLPASGELLQGVSDDSSFELRRFFNRPSNLDDDQGVTLTFTELANGARIALNGSVLNATTYADPSEGGVISFEVREKLLPHNELTVAFSKRESFQDAAAMILAAVTLDIESSSRDET